MKIKRIAIIVATVSIWTSARLDYAELLSSLVWGVGNAWAEFPALVPNATLLRSTSVAQLMLTSYPPSCLAFFTAQV